MNSVDSYDSFHVELDCSVVTTSAQVALADVLPVEGVDLLLGNDFAGERVFPLPADPVGVSEEAFEASATGGNVDLEV